MKLEKVPVFDGHNDTLLRIVMPASGRKRSFFHRSNLGHIDVPRASESGFFGGLFAICLPYPPEQEPDMESMITYRSDGFAMPELASLDQKFAHKTLLGVLGKIFDLVDESHGKVKIVRTVEDLDICRKGGHLGLVLHIEGAEGIDRDFHLLHVLYECGLRSVGIVWSRPNAFGYGVPFRFPHSPDIGPGLSNQGKELVKICNSMGILVDMAHLNLKGFRDVTALSDAPLVVSHSGVFSITPSPRNLLDEQLDAVGETDGIIGITFTSCHLRSDGKIDGDASIKDLVNHITYIVERIGIDHIGLGSDFDGAKVPSEIGDVTGLPKLFHVLENEGFDREAIEKIAYQNWLRVIKQTWK